jgi:hypothetical protein
MSHRIYQFYSYFHVLLEGGHIFYPSGDVHVIRLCLTVEQFCFTAPLFYASLFYGPLFYASLFYDPLFYASLFYGPLFYASLFYGPCQDKDSFNLLLLIFGLTPFGWLRFFFTLTLSFRGATAPSGPWPPYCRGFTITLRHTTLRRTPLDE